MFGNRWTDAKPVNLCASYVKTKLQVDVIWLSVVFFVIGCPWRRILHDRIFHHATNDQLDPMIAVAMYPAASGNISKASKNPVGPCGP